MNALDNNLGHQGDHVGRTTQIIPAEADRYVVLILEACNHLDEFGRETCKACLDENSTTGWVLAPVVAWGTDPNGFIVPCYLWGGTIYAGIMRHSIAISIELRRVRTEGDAPLPGWQKARGHELMRRLWKEYTARDVNQLRAKRIGAQR